MRRILRIKSLGPAIGGGSTSTRMIDGDGDGKCREEGGKWVPCPPGVPTGSSLRTVLGRQVYDLPEGGGIDPLPKIPKKYQAAMKERLTKMLLTKENIRRTTANVAQQIPNDIKDLARDWYVKVHNATRKMTDDINKKHGTKFSFEQSAAVIAALSPAREFGKNVGDANDLMQAFAADEPFIPSKQAIREFKGDRKRLKALLARATDKQLRPSDFTNEELDMLAVLHPVFNTKANTTGFVNVVRSLIILRESQSINDALSGPKMRSFYSNIVNPYGDRVTIDTWMYRIMLNPKKKFLYAERLLNLAGHEKYGTKAQNLFQGIPGAIAGTGIEKDVGLYPLFAEIVRDIAVQLNLPPAAVQAMLWEEARKRAGKKVTEWSRIEKFFKKGL